MKQKTNRNGGKTNLSAQILFRHKIQKVVTEIEIIRKMQTLTGYLIILRNFYSF